MTFGLSWSDAKKKKDPRENDPAYQQMKALEKYKGPYIINKEVLRDHQERLYVHPPKMIETPVGTKTQPTYTQDEARKAGKRTPYEPDPPEVYQLEWPILPAWPYIGKTRWVWGKPPNLRQLIGW